VGRYPFDVELFHLLLQAGLSRRFHQFQEMHSEEGQPKGRTGQTGAGGWAPRASLASILHLCPPFRDGMARFAVGHNCKIDAMTDLDRPHERYK